VTAVADSFLGTFGEMVSETYSEFGPFQPDRAPGPLERRYTNEASAFLDVRDARVHYRDEGPRDAPTLVALHGTYSSLHTWEGWVEALTDEFRVVRLDMPGFGLTGPRDGRHTLRELVVTVGALCDALDLEQVAVAGNSLGGGVAWRLAVERPDLVSGVLLLNAGGATLLSVLSGNLIATFGTSLQRYATPRMAARLMLLDAHHDRSTVTTDLVTRYHDLMLREGNRGAVVDLARNYERDHFDETRHDRGGARVPRMPAAQTPEPEPWDEYDLADVSAPVLFQWGTEDDWLPGSFGRDLAAQVGDHQFVTYDAVGHAPMEEAPRQTAPDAAAFLREL
jgi:pimeloyl-ACP methyl ester carboxylesterase